MGQEQYCRSLGTDIAGVTRLHASFLAHIKQWEAGKFGCDDDDRACAGYWIGYPCFMELIGHEWCKETARADAYHALNRVHALAVQHLMELAERFGVDSGPLWSAGTACRDLFAGEPWKYYLDPDAFWPQCLGVAMTTLPNDIQTIVRSGETTFMRLMAKANIDTKDQAGVLTRWLTPATIQPASPRQPESGKPSKGTGEPIREMPNRDESEASWHHAPSDQKPVQYAHGPLVGTKKDLGVWLGGTPGPNVRTLEQKAEAGTVWVIRRTRTCFEVWFRNQGTYATANQERLRRGQAG